MIAHIIERYPDISGDNAIMIGDRKYDVEGAKSFDLPTVGVLYGYGGREELCTAGAEYIAESPEELEKILLNL